MYSHVKVLNDILSVVTKMLSVCRLWLQPRPCHSKTTGHSSLSDRLLETVAAFPHHCSLGGWKGRGENPPAITPATSDESSPGQAWHHQSHTLYLHSDSSADVFQLCVCQISSLWNAYCLVSLISWALRRSPAAIRRELPPVPPPTAPDRPRTQQLQDPQHKGMG